MIKYGKCIKPLPRKSPITPEIFPTKLSNSYDLICFISMKSFVRNHNLTLNQSSDWDSFLFPSMLYSSTFLCCFDSQNFHHQKRQTWTVWLTLFTLQLKVLLDCSFLTMKELDSIYYIQKQTIAVPQTLKLCSHLITMN